MMVYGIGCTTVLGGRSSTNYCGVQTNVPWWNDPCHMCTLSRTVLTQWSSGLCHFRGMMKSYEIQRVRGPCFGNTSFSPVSASFWHHKQQMRRWQSKLRAESVQQISIQNVKNPHGIQLKIIILSALFVSAPAWVIVWNTGWIAEQHGVAARPLSFCKETFGGSELHILRFLVVTQRSLRLARMVPATRSWRGAMAVRWR